MTLACRLRFGWDLKLLPEKEPASVPLFRIRRAEKAELPCVSDLLLSNFVMDSSWTDLLREVRAPLEEENEAVFEKSSVPCLLVALGQMIGVRRHLISSLTVRIVSYQPLFLLPGFAVAKLASHY